MKREQKNETNIEGIITFISHILQKKTHVDCRGHTVVIMSLGRRTVLRSSLKQNLNVEISTEGYLVVSHDGMSAVLRSKHFNEAQGYNA